MSTVVTYYCDRCGVAVKRVQTFLYGLENQLKRFDACDDCVTAVDTAMQRALSATATPSPSKPAEKAKGKTKGA